MKKEIISGLKWTYFGVILKFISQLLIFSILAHILAPEDFGVISMSFIFINFALLLSQFGIGTALVQRKVLNKDHIKTGFTMAIFLGAFLFLAIYFSAPIISVFFSNSELVKILRTLALMFFFNGISMISRSLLQREMNFKDLMKIDIYSYFLGYGVIGIISALILKNVWALVFATICQSFMDSVLSYWFRMFPVSLKIKKTEAIELLTFGGWFSIGGFFNYFAINGDNFIIGKYLGSVSLGIYSRAYTLMTLPAVYFASIFEKVFFP
ncbi:MAG: oligosaccharide flippase family protein, partial [Acidobacteriota bacterium]